MDFKPRKLPVFNRVERKEATTPMIQERSAIYQWNGMDASKGNFIGHEGLGYAGRAAGILMGKALERLYFLCPERNLINWRLRHWMKG